MKPETPLRLWQAAQSNRLRHKAKRFTYQKDIPMEQLKNIDVVLISHDHYDHLDYPTIQKQKGEIGGLISSHGALLR
ncbi:MAG: MBL fold metallo-hydrolase [Owenweeksia sp.]|nr:MBL fold metallo-hydrolase [Owenweeksia sp.]